MSALIVIKSGELECQIFDQLKRWMDPIRFFFNEI
jgi:hypothetical protein